jgi:AraC family transcriptional regulator of adaptative response/methylated-DNA-[protein]-cysteine methyltransferase
VREVCRLINNAGIGEVTLEALGSQLAVSPDHLQRTFKRAVGITPRQYADTRRMERFKMQLRDGLDVTHALYEAGYSSSSRLYEQAPAQLGMTPASYRRGGAGVQITYALSPCVLGVLLVAATERGICKVSLGDSEAQLEADLVEEFSAATLTRDDQQLVAWVAQIARHVEGRQPRLDVPLDIRATAFQRQVWEQLQAIPYGTTRSYQAVADAIGRPTAARAVAQACASNPVALVIPCHRVVGANGGLSGYRWGIGRKQALLTREAESTGDGE